MLEILVAFLTFAAVVFGILVRILFEESKQLRSDLEARLHAIEGLEGPFERKLADAGPPPLRRVLTLNIHLDVRFWIETLQFTPQEMDEIKTRVRLPDDLSKKAGIEDFDKWFYGNIRVRIQEWRGGYTHVEVEYPLRPSEKPKTIDLYCGNDRERLWDFELPTRAGEGFTHPTLSLEWDGHRARLYALGGRFESASPAEWEPASHNVFLTVPLDEGPRAESYFKPGRVEYWPNVFYRFYQHLDTQRGLAWVLWIRDFDLDSRTQGNEPEARRRLLAEWRERFAWDDAGKEWYQRVVKAMEDAHEKEIAEYASEPTLEDEPAPQPEAKREV